MAGKRVVVIGAGLAGLSAAALLAESGFDVTVVEKNETPGGVARKYEISEFTFDMGPTWYLMPELVALYFSLFRKKPTDFFDLYKLDPSCKVFLGKEEHLLLRPDMEHNRQVFESLEKGGASKLDEYLENAHRKYRTIMAKFMYSDLISLSDILNMKMIFEGIKLRVFQKIGRHVNRFFTNPVIVKLLEFSYVVRGCKPDGSSALYSFLSHGDFSRGVYYPSRGIYSLVNALYVIARARDARFFFGDEVKSIQVDKKKRKATGVYIDRGFIPADIVLSAVDYHHTEMELLPARYRSYSKRYWKSRVMAPSAMIILLGVKKRLKSLEHHNIVLSEDQDAHVTHLFDNPGWPDNPSFYVTCASKTDANVAPDGCENLYILVPVAPGLDDSKQLREQFADRILAKLEEYTGESIRKHIVVKRLISHRNFSFTHNLFSGSALGLAHTSMQTAVFRPSRKSQKVENLYYTGHYTHPGIGMPMVLVSSQLTVKRIINDRRN